MTGHRDKQGATQAIVLSKADLPLADRLQSALMLGDLVVAAARRARDLLRSAFARRAHDMTAEGPPEPCGVC